MVTFNRTNNSNFQIYPPDYSTLGINVYNDDTPQWFFNVSGYFGINSGDTNTFLRNEIQIVDTVALTKGRHELATGVDYSYGQGDTVNNFRANGRFTFSNAAGYTGDALADFYLGRFSSFEQAIGEYKNTRMHFLATFIQDTYRVNRQLTLNLGLRWDPFFPYTDVTDRLGVLPARRGVAGLRERAGGRGLSGRRGVPDGRLRRVVGATSARASASPTIRSATARAASARATACSTTGRTRLPPTARRTRGRSARSSRSRATASTAWRIRTPGGRTRSRPIRSTCRADVQFFLPNAAFSYDPNLKNGRLQSWNVTLEREIMPTYLVRVGLCRLDGRPPGDGPRAESRHLRAGRDDRHDQPAPAAVPDLQHDHDHRVGRASRSTTRCSSRSTSGMSKGFSVLSSYTLSKTLDHASEAKQTGTTQTNPFDLEFDWGYANSDRRHRWVTSFLWQIPGAFDSGVADAVLSDWSLTGILAMQSGGGFTVTSGVDNARSGTGSQRADITGDPEAVVRSVELARRSCSGSTRRCTAPTRWARSATRAATRMRGPGSKNVDLGLHKTFATGGGTTLQVRIEAFNAFNWVNLATPTTTQNSANFGRILTAGAPRGDAGRAARVVLDGCTSATARTGAVTIAGLFAAVVTPVHDRWAGRLAARFDRLVDFLVGAGVSGVCIAGATGEYPHFETADRKAVIRRAADRLPRDSRAARRHRRAVDAPRHRARRGRARGRQPRAAAADADVLPLRAGGPGGVRARVSDTLRAPCLLYDLPDFTNGLAPATVLNLLRDDGVHRRDQGQQRRAWRTSPRSRRRANGHAVVAAGRRRPRCCTRGCRPDGTAASPASPGSARSCWWRSIGASSTGSRTRRRACRGCSTS